MLAELENNINDLAQILEISIVKFEGDSNYIHLFVDFNPSIDPIRFINNLKTVSSRHMQELYGDHIRQCCDDKNVLWSRGYCLLPDLGGALSVIEDYIKKAK